MEIKNKKQQKGITLLEFLLFMALVLPFIFMIMGIYEYTRISYILDEILENELGNKNRFIMNIDQDFNPIKGEESRLNQEVVDMQQRISDTINAVFSNECSGSQQVEVEMFQTENNNVNVMSYVDKNTGKRVAVDTIFHIQARVSLQRDRCVRIGSIFLGLMDENIQSQRETLVDYQL